MTLRTHLFLGDSCHLISRSLGPLRKCSNCGKSSPALASPYHIHDDITSLLPSRLQVSNANQSVRPTDCRLKVEQKCNSHKTRCVSRGGRRRHNWWFIGSVLNLRRTHTYTHECDDGASVLQVKAKFGMRECAPSPLSVIKHCHITTEKIPSQSIPTLRKQLLPHPVVRPHLRARAGTLKKKSPAAAPPPPSPIAARTDEIQKIVRTMSERAS